MRWIFFFFFFFFQAEDGIRDYKVTGVQTCALPIFPSRGGRRKDRHPTTPCRRRSPPARSATWREAGRDTRREGGAKRASGAGAPRPARQNKTRTARRAR